HTGKGTSHGTTYRLAIHGLWRRFIVDSCIVSELRRIPVEITSMLLIFVVIVVIFFVLSVVFGSFFTVETGQVAIVQRLGKFARVAGPGLNWKTPLIEAVVRR